ncbi:MULTISPECIES: DNA/RNA non-specific endonuclease [Bacillus]|uniref:DNA/RNA non-specific endonuclease n=1 Tax=Bacillus TaxID=1386 RepID=UPI0004D412A1|nr:MULTISPECIES: DNA/RNA non-specific endonuclease [Bacillus]KEP28580.1 endonuclease [Bacillus safensis]MCY8696395.1 DNA/RNA non-specific endonuclease [Bacillus inaquosorum]
MSFEGFEDFNQKLVEMQQQKAMERYSERKSERERITNELKHQLPVEVDTQERVTKRKNLIDRRNGLALENILGEDDLLPISYLEAGLKAAKSVCRIEVRDKIGRIRGHGTGFLVSPSLLLTNNHVLKDEEDAIFSVAQFNYELDLNNLDKQIKSFRFSPKRFFITSQSLDFTLVAVEEVSSDSTSLSDFYYLPLLPSTGKVLLGEYVSIIQHPSGAPKAVTVRENQVKDIFDSYIHYSTDTKRGSSGSPVFNDQWIVVGLHHAAVKDPKNESKALINEGIRISSIMKYLEDQRPNLGGDQNKLLNMLYAPAPEAIDKNEKIEIEQLGLEWYEGLKGYDPKFLGENYEVPHPKLNSDIEDDIALLKNGGAILDYTHFSILMSKSRRLAYYTAVNIDGGKLEDVKREKKWYYDPRIDIEFQCGNELYVDNELDKGHLVRRRDPVWGVNAEKANKDTFHYTNCSPQYSTFNQGIWNDLEDYILDNAKKYNFKASVFTGPVFREDDKLYRGIRIPSEFWKIAVMIKEDGRISATAYLQSQKTLIDNLEFAYGEYKTYQVTIAYIESLTGLNFNDLKEHEPKNLELIQGYVVEKVKDIKF